MDTKLPIDVEVRNYKTAQDLVRKYDLEHMKEIYEKYKDGVPPDKELTNLRKENADLKDRLKVSLESDMQMFETKERAVKDVPRIKAMKEALAKQKSLTLHQTCMQDGKYAMMFTNYRTSVEEEYQSKKEEPKHEEELLYASPT